MDSSAWVLQTIVPIALGFMMFGLGLELTLDDFRRVARAPKAVAVGLVCQAFILPVACYFVARFFALSPPLAMGLMLLSAAPGGPTANFISHLARGDVALNITLTAINSLVSLATLPLVIEISSRLLLGAERAAPPQFFEILQVIGVVLIPAGLGMYVHARKPLLARKLDVQVQRLSLVLLLTMITAVAIARQEDLRDALVQVGAAALAFNLLSMAVGYSVPRLFRLPPKQAVAIGIEIGIHNGGVAIAVALKVLHDESMAIPAAIYGVIATPTALLFALWMRRGLTRSAPGS